jgi:hypothetical protein
MESRKVVDNLFVKNVVKWGAQLPSTLIPGLGTGISAGYNFTTNVAPVTQNILSDHDKGGFQGVAKNLTGGK